LSFCLLFYYLFFIQIAAANAELAEVETAGQAAAGAIIGGILTPFGVGPGSLGALAPYISGKITGYYWILDDGSVDMTDTSPRAQPSAVYTAATGLYYLPSVVFSTTSDQFTVAP
jgi:hypothetical protein